jgi:predicted glycoside hydrolase/deacetylase ChbG (UPF0249 family)
MYTPRVEKRRLLIVADDLGSSTQRTHGIFTCFEEGVVRSAGVIPNMSDSARAAKHAREKGLPCGIHLNLTEESPIGNPKDVASLVDAQGNFQGVAGLRRLLGEGSIDRAHLEREVRAQIEWMFDHYGYPTHLSSHGHIHVHPLVMPIVIEAAERYSIRFIRMPEEQPLPPFGYEVPEEQLERVAELNAETAAARALLAGSSIETTDHFRGSTLLGNASKKNMRHILARLPEGVTELMTHPSSPTSYGTPFDLDPQRLTELAMLLDPELPKLLAERKIELISYADL